MNEKTFIIDVMNCYNSPCSGSIYNQKFRTRYIRGYWDAEPETFARLGIIDDEMTPNGYADSHWCNTVTERMQYKVSGGTPVSPNWVKHEPVEFSDAEFEKIKPVETECKVKGSTCKPYWVRKGGLIGIALVDDDGLIDVPSFIHLP